MNLREMHIFYIINIEETRPGKDIILGHEQRSLAKQIGGRKLVKIIVNRLTTLFMSSKFYIK